MSCAFTHLTILDLPRDVDWGSLVVARSQLAARNVVRYAPDDRRRPQARFWIAYALLSLASLAIAWHLFPLAIPLVNLDITMSRGCDAAETLAAERKLAPEGATVGRRLQSR
jgi:hypothetical protein